MSSIIITHKRSGLKYDLDKLGFRVISADFPGPSFTHTYQQQSRYQQIETDKTVNVRDISLSFYIRAESLVELQAKRIQIGAILAGDEDFYVTYKEMPHLRFLCEAENVTVTRINNSYSANGSATLRCPSGFAETIANTLDDDFTYQAGKWGLGLKLLNGKEMKYTYSDENTCDIYNPGVIPLKANDNVHCMQIIINGSSPGNLTITNETTGQTFKYEKSFNKTFMLDGCIPIADSKQDYVHCNHAFVDFARGWNKIKVSGLNSGFKIGFKTRFYY